MPRDNVVQCVCRNRCTRSQHREALTNAARENNSMLPDSTVLRQTNTLLQCNKSVPLITAISEDANVETIKILIKCGNDVNAVNVFGQSPLHIAVAKVNIEVTRYLLNAGANVNAKDGKLITPLHYALLNENIKKEIIELLLDFGADVNAVDNKGATPLHLALKYGSNDSVHILLDRKANVITKDNVLTTPLHLAVRKGHLDIIKRLLHLKVDVNAQNLFGESALHVALRSNPLQFCVVQELLNNGALSNSADKGELTPLHCAVRRYALDVVKLLLKHKADVNAKDSSGHTPVLYLFAALKYDYRIAEKNKVAVLNKNSDCSLDEIQNGLTNEGERNIASYYSVQIFKCLLSAGADVESRSKSGWSSLLYCTISGNTLAMQTLIDHGANVNASCPKSYPALFYATHAPNKNEIFEVLMKAGADVNFRAVDGRTPLISAASLGDTFTVYSLLQNGANVDMVNGKGYCALHLAAVNGYESVVEQLLRFRADIHLKTRSAITSLSLAALGGTITIVRHLLNLGADVHDADVNGVTPLLYALKRKKPSVEIVEELIENGADVSAISVFGETAILLAATQNRDILRLVLRYPFDANAALKMSCKIGDIGDTPLHLASIFAQDAQNIRILLSVGANLNAKNCDQKTPLFCAVERANCDTFLELMEFEPEFDMYSCVTGLNLWRKVEGLAVCVQFIIKSDFIQHPRPLGKSYEINWLHDSVSLALTNFGEDNTNFDVYREKCFYEVKDMQKIALHCSLSV